MSVIKLNSSHIGAVRRLMTTTVAIPPDVNVNSSITQDKFCEIYLTDLNSFHAYGLYEGDSISAMISFYESSNEPAWFYTQCYATDINRLAEVLDTVITYNESRYRMTFYNKVNTPGIRGIGWSTITNQRYMFVDSYVVPAKTLCFYNHSGAMFNSQLFETDLIVRCNILKQEYRTIVPLGGNL